MICVKKLKWHDIPGYEGIYKINVIGEIMSLWYSRKRILSPRINSDGYPCVGLCKNGKRKTYKVHRLMVNTFYKPKKKYETRHLNGSRDFNVLSNLAPGTKSENQKDRIKHGTDSRGEKGWKSKLKNADIIEIRKTYSLGKITQTELAKRYNTTQGNIGSIVRNETWKTLL